MRGGGGGVKLSSARFTQAEKFSLILHISPFRTIDFSIETPLGFPILSQSLYLYFNLEVVSRDRPYLIVTCAVGNFLTF